MGVMLRVNRLHWIDSVANTGEEEELCAWARAWRLLAVRVFRQQLPLTVDSLTVTTIQSTLREPLPAAL